MNIKSLKTIKELPPRILKFVTEEDIEDLVRNGLCPHYKLINPNTKKETILFSSDELYEWVNKTLLKYAPSKFEPEITVYEFNGFMNNNPMPPKELMGIKSLMYLPKTACTSPPGIYFLVHGDKVVYVGQAVNIQARIVTHVNENCKVFDGAFFIPVAIEHLNKVEQAFMKTLRPKYNMNNGKTCDVHIEFAQTFYEQSEDAYMKASN